MDLFTKLASRWLRDLDRFQAQQKGSSKLCFKMDSLRDVSSKCFHHEVSQRLKRWKRKHGTRSSRTQTGPAFLSPPLRKQPKILSVKGCFCLCCVSKYYYLLKI